MSEQVKRDLEWLATTPALVTEQALGFPAVGALDEVTPLESELEAAENARRAERLRLGVYFEDLVELHLRHKPGVTDVRRGIPIRENKRTLGELDFLFQNEDGQREHWEVAVKFYLYHEAQDPDPNRCFLGPRTIDRLDRKVSRMRDHQLPLPSTPAAVESLGAEEVQNSRALIRGRLFYPIAMDWRQCRVGTFATPEHLRGWWAPAKSLAQIPRADHYLIARKRNWLSCPPVSARQPEHTLQSLTAHLDTIRMHPVQIIGVDANHRELHRGFVVPDHWPHLDRQ